MTELLLRVEMVVEVQFSCHADKQSPLQVSRELGVIVRQSGVGLSPWTGVGAAVHKKLRAGLESVDEEPHVSAVVLEVEEEVVVHSTGGRIEQNGGKVLIEFSVFSLHNPPHVGGEVNTETVATISSGPVYERVRMVLGENETSVCLKVSYISDVINISHQMVSFLVMLTELQRRLNLVAIGRYQSLQGITDHHKLEVVPQFVASPLICKTLFQK